jgi:hypothetical protein
MGLMQLFYEIDALLRVPETLERIEQKLDALAIPEGDLSPIKEDLENISDLSKPTTTE